MEKLDDKYLVIKKEDLERYFSQYTHGIFTTEEEGKVIDRVPFNTVLEEIAKDRDESGKTPNNYVVLNLDDKIDVGYLRAIWLGMGVLTVSDVATELINAILRVQKNDNKLNSNDA